jgi:putative transposase
VKTIRTIKLKFSGNHKANEILPNWLNALNWLSQIVFDQKDTNSNRLATAYYKTAREKFNLPSQLTCSLFRTVSATYKTQKTRHKKWSLAEFKKPSIPVIWRRDFSRSKKGVTLWADPITFDDSRPIPDHWKDSKITLKGKQWYLNLSYEIDVPEPKTIGHIIGVDQGLKRLFVATDSKNNKLFYKANYLNQKLFNIRKTRAKVQAVGTRSSRQLLQRMSGHEASVTEHAVHVASKRLVNWADSIGARKIVLEDLSNIREASNSKGKTLRSRVNRWPYGMFTFFVTYKAQAKGIAVEMVSPRNTSRMCHKCGHIDKFNRNGFLFRCVACGCTADADWNASKNIAGRSMSIGLNSMDTGSSKSPRKLGYTFEMVAHNSVTCSMPNV